MTRSDTPNAPAIRFKAKLRRPVTSRGKATRAFVVLPRTASEKLPRRGRTTVAGRIGPHDFQATLEPDGHLSHWFSVDDAMLAGAKASIGDTVTIAIHPVVPEPEPVVPPDLRKALAASPAARATWDATTTIARVDWIHWITTAKQATTRTLRIGKACDMLAGGKRRVCCFDPSGHYSKAFGAPAEADGNQAE